MRLITARHPDDPVLDMALTDALLRRVGAGDAEPAARVYRPGPTLAFGRLDAIRDGYAAARAAAVAHGLTPVLRLGGGRAAAYDEGSVVVDVVSREGVVAEGIERRFAAATELVAGACRSAGIDVEVGELPGEYCPGRWSLHAGGVKVAGLAQRSVKGASLVSAVIVVAGGDRIRAALVDVYAALGLEWDPRTAGAAEDVVASARAAEVERACAAALGGPVEAGFDAATAALAGELRARHA